MEGIKVLSSERGSRRGRRGRRRGRRARRGRRNRDARSMGVGQRAASLLLG